MRRTKNADEFLGKYRGLRARYESVFGPWLKEVRHQYALPHR